jgi:hypothetical protein
MEVEHNLWLWGYICSKLAEQQDGTSSEEANLKIKITWKPIHLSLSVESVNHSHNKAANSTFWQP